MKEKVMKSRHTDHGAGAAWRLGRADKYLPEALRYTSFL
jgi:hypothetical protein